MKYYGLAIDLVDDPQLIEKYKEYHRQPWPEPLQGLKEVGIEDMKIFLLGRRMFMFMSTVDQFDPAIDFARYMEQNPKAQEWDDLMRTYQQKLPEAGPDEWWAFMEQVFDLQDHI
ncbi:MAG: L-rhamnose mutarotase [Candidatus Latescibacteria bacterium]|nr:L-rhamnose mutarotase [Candidatus Latescibacterota bacterium]